MNGLIGGAMAPEQRGAAPQGEAQQGPQKSPATFMALQVMSHMFQPQTAERWAQAAADDPVPVISKLATQAVMQSMQASGGRATPEDAQAALREVIASMVMFLVATEMVPAEQAEQLAQEAAAAALGGEQQPGEGQPMPEEAQGSQGAQMPPQQGMQPGAPMVGGM